MKHLGRLTAVITIAGLAAGAQAQCPPSAPTGLSASSNVCGEVRLNWNDVSGATNYYIYRNTVNSWASASFVGTNVFSQFTDLTVFTGTRYYYWVTAFRLPCLGNNTSAHSGVASGYPAASPYAPSNVSASNGTVGCGVVVSWAQQPYLGGDAESYTIYRNTINLYLTSSSLGTVSYEAREFLDSTAQAGTTYYYWVRADSTCGNEVSDSDSGYRGSGQVPNDLCANAIAVTNGSRFGSTRWCVNSDGSASCGSSTASPDVWYRYTAPAGGTLMVDTCSAATTYDTVLSIHGGCPGTTANQIACNDDACGLQSELAIPVSAGQTYFIRVAGYNGDSGDFVLSVSGPGSACYANCDNSTTAPLLNVLDFVCFLNEFAAQDPSANCDQSTTPPVLNVLDFQCFLNAFAAGCSS